MKDLIRKILRETQREENDEFEWIPEISPAQEFLYNKMINLTISKSKKKKDFMIYKDESDNILMADNIETGANPKLYVDYDEIWLKLSEMGLNNEEINKLCVKMLEETHKRKVSTAALVHLRHHQLLE